MTTSDDAFTRATHLVADLDSPFYDEERQRDVWNEASAIGFQTMLWGVLGLACAMAWIGGGPQVGWAFGLLMVSGVAGHLALRHANRLGVTGWENARLNRPRTYLVIGLYFGTLAGIMVNLEDALPSSVASASFVGGVKMGVPIGLIVFALALVVNAVRRRGQTPE